MAYLLSVLLLLWTGYLTHKKQYYMRNISAHPAFVAMLIALYKYVVCGGAFDTYLFLVAACTWSGVTAYNGAKYGKLLYDLKRTVKDVFVCSHYYGDPTVLRRKQTYERALEDSGNALYEDGILLVQCIYWEDRTNKDEFTYERDRVIQSENAKRLEFLRTQEHYTENKEFLIHKFFYKQQTFIL